MKQKKNRLLSMFMLLVFSINICIAQELESAIVRVRRGGNIVPVRSLLVEENGKKVLVIEKDEAIEFNLEAGVILESTNKKAVDVLNGNVLVGLTPDSEAKIIAKRGAVEVEIGGLDELIVRVRDTDATRQIVAQSTFLTYKTVKDNFGKKFAQSYFVIQVDVRNEKLDKQFIVQTLDVILDPNQCERGPELAAEFQVNDCLEIFDEFFIYPSAQQPVRKQELLATAKADLNRSNRNWGFRILGFTASMGSVLTGFNGLLGRDGVKGVSVLGTTFTDAANALFPNTADLKTENLKNALYDDDVIIKSKESKTFNIFIPTERIFYDASWERYIQPARDSDIKTYKLKVILDLILLSSATGVLVDNDAPKVQVKSGDNITALKEKFQIQDSLRRSAVLSRDVRTILESLKKDANLKSSANNDLKIAAAKSKIVKALKLMKIKAETTGSKFKVTTAIVIDEAKPAADLYKQLETIIKDASINAADEMELAQVTSDVANILKAID